MGSVRTTVARRFMLVLAIAVLVPSVASAQLGSHNPNQGASFQGAGLADPFYEQLDACAGGPASQIFPDFGNARLQSADDFTLGAPETVIEVLAPGSFFNGTGPLEDVSMEFYDDDGPGGFPGTLLCAEAGLENFGGLGDPILQVTLDGTCALGAETYWFSALPIMQFGVGGQWGWDSNGSANGSEFVFRDPSDLLAGGVCLDWQFGVSTCGIGVASQDLCFGLGREDTGTDGGTGGVPAVGTTGVVVTLLIVMAISIFFLRRRQTA